MVHIWRALVAEPKQAVDANFDLILAQLLTEMGGNMWRNREASCLALADLLQVTPISIDFTHFKSRD
jgi:proteasome component ECM29